MRDVFNSRNEVGGEIECSKLGLQRNRHQFGGRWEVEYTLCSNPSIFWRPLWLRYSWSRSFNSSRPSKFVILLDWMERIFNFLRLSKPCVHFHLYKDVEICARGRTSSLVILFLPNHSSSRLTRSSNPSIFCYVLHLECHEMAKWPCILTRIRFPPNSRLRSVVHEVRPVILLILFCTK